MPRGSHQRFASDVLPTTEGRSLSAHQRTKSLKDVLKFGSKASASRLSLEKASREDPVEPALDTPVASPPPALDHAADSSPPVTRGVSAAQRMFDEGEGVVEKPCQPILKALAALEAPVADADAAAAQIALQDSPAMATVTATTTESGAAVEPQQVDEQQMGERNLKDAVVAMFAARPASHVGPSEPLEPAEAAAEIPMETATTTKALPESAIVAEEGAVPERAVVADEPTATAANPAAAAGATPHRRTVSFMDRMAALFDTSAVTEGANRDTPVNPAPTPATTPANAVLVVEHKRQISLSQAFRAYFVPTQEEDPAAFSPEGQYLPPAFREGRRGSENGAGAMAAAAAAAAAEVEAESAAAKGSAQAEVVSTGAAPVREERDAAAEEAAEEEEGENNKGKEAVDASCTVWLSRFFSRK